MKRKFAVFAGALLAVVGLTGLGFSEGNWELAKQDKGIVVYTRPIQGSDLKEFKGTGVVEAPIEVMEKILDDLPSWTKWLPDCIVAQSVKVEGNISVSYFELKSPWPVSNRDFLNRTVKVKTPTSITYKYNAVADASMPVKSGKVRITEMSGAWTLEKQGEKTQVTYQNKANPGGSLPAWLANSTVIKQPFNSIMNLRNMVKLPKYLSK